MQGEVTSSPAGAKVGRSAGDPHMITLTVQQGDYGKDTVRPLTIKQILDAEEPYPEAGHQVDKVTISHVRAPFVLCSFFAMS